MVAIPRSDYEILDDWGGGATIGLGGTASNTIVADDVFVPAHLSGALRLEGLRDAPRRARSASSCTATRCIWRGR